MAYGSDDGPESCATCYSDLEPGAQFCPNCGTAAPPAAGGYAGAPGSSLAGEPEYEAPANVPFDDGPELCATCYTDLEPGARFCPNCGATAAPAAGGYAGAPGSSLAGEPGYEAPVNVPNYLVQAILATICCCLPTGIVAIVYAAQVNGKLAAGDYDGARSYSKNAKTWCWVSLGAGIAYWIVIAPLVVFST